MALLLFLFAGCAGEAGPERLSISGRVLLNGEPLNTGTIMFIPTGATEGPTTGGQIENGTYSIPANKGAVAGEYEVRISSIQETGQKIEAGTPHPPGTMVDEIKEIIPPEYSANSSLRAEIKPGNNEDVDFELEVP